MVSAQTLILMQYYLVGANTTGIKQSSVQRAGDMILFNTLTDGEYRTMNNTLPRLLETHDDRAKFIAAIRSPVARDVLNFDVRYLQLSLNVLSCVIRAKSTR